MARNFHVVSTWSSGNGSGAGANAFSASRTSTAESLPIEYSITGRSNSATTSRSTWRLSASSWRRCERRAGAGVGSCRRWVAIAAICYNGYSSDRCLST
jgi:hypothetical protein